MLVFDNKIGTYVQGNYNNNKYVSDVYTGLNFKLDSYTLGTTVDGKLVSGFTGNQQQVTIYGNMINLDANTVVGNNFVLQSANIGSLDVNKLTGNVSSWVLSQWTSATGNKVTIDGNGLYFSPGTSRMTTNGFESWRNASAGIS